MSDLEMPDVYNECMTKARKAHRCCECRGCIPVGENYQLIKGLWDGRWSTLKTCTDCAALRKDIQGRDEISLGELCDYIFDSDCVDGMKRYMDIRRKRNAPESHKGWMEKREAEIDGQFVKNGEGEGS